MDSTFTASSLATGMILASQMNYQTAVPPLGPKQKAPPKPVVMNADTAVKEDPGMLSTCPMLYAIVSDLARLRVANVPDWQPQVHSVRNRLSKPALVPLNLCSISLGVECQIGTGFVTIQGSWMLYCLKQGVRCDCLFVLPISSEGVVTSLDIEMGTGRCYTTLIISENDAENRGKESNTEAKNTIDIGACSPELFFFKIPQVSAKQQLDILVAQAWLYGDTIIKKRAISQSIKIGVLCGFTKMMAFETTKKTFDMLLQERHQGSHINVRKYTRSAGIALVGGSIIGFGNLKATIGNLPSIQTYNPMLDTKSGALYCCDWGLCPDCCCSCFLDSQRHSWAACFANSLVYSCEHLCSGIILAACFEVCIGSLCNC